MSLSVLPRVLTGVLVAGCLAAAAGFGAVSSAQAANWLEKSFWLSGPRYDHSVPECTDSGPLSKISSRFSEKEGNFWNSSVKIVSFDEVREIAWEPWASGTIPRRFCTAFAVVSDGSRHKIAYSIIEDGGIIGAWYGVEWCVRDFDRNWSHLGNCNAALPDSIMDW